MNINVYSLLHIAPNQFGRKNLGGTFEKSIEVYFKNAITLQKSLKQIDLEFTLVTNNVQYLIDNFPELVPIRALNRFVSLFDYYKKPKQQK
jgi:hypothetical protein